MKLTPPIACLCCGGRAHCTGRLGEIVQAHVPAFVDIEFRVAKTSKLYIFTPSHLSLLGSSLKSVSIKCSLRPGSPLTSACCPGCRTLPHSSHLRHHGCQSNPRDCLRSAERTTISQSVSQSLMELRGGATSPSLSYRNTRACRTGGTSTSSGGTRPTSPGILVVAMVHCHRRSRWRRRRMNAVL